MAMDEPLAAKAKTQEASRMLQTGLKHLPDDKLAWVPMGQAKTPLLIMAECAGALKWVASELRGQSDPGVYERVMQGTYTSREEVLALLAEAEAELYGAMEALTAEQLAETRQVFWGQATVGELLWTGATHTIYHAGQLNYIQTLLGDTEMHRA